MGFRKASEAERREQILAAAEVIASRLGLAGLTLRSVAAEAGLSHGSLLFHFGTKEELVQGLFARTLSWFLEVQNEASSTGLAGLLGVLDNEISAIGSMPDRAAVLLDFWLLSTRDEVIRRQLVDAVALYGTALAATLTADRDAPDSDTRALADFAVSIVFGAALRRLIAHPDGGALLTEQTVTSLVRFASFQVRD
jgi:TetR/AcrR family transcriptional regulator, transcriptional repressor of bet genes